MVFPLSNTLIYFLVPFPIANGKSDRASIPPGGQASIVYNRSLHYGMRLAQLPKSSLF